MLKLKPLITDKKFKARSLGWVFAKEMSEDLSQSSRTLFLTEDLKRVKGGWKEGNYRGAFFRDAIVFMGPS